MSHAVIGRNAVRRDALDKVRGTAMYTSDITLPGMAYAAGLLQQYSGMSAELIHAARPSRGF